MKADDVTILIDDELPPALEEQLDEVVAAISDRPLVALTGAGISTDSGIPDYRGEGAPKRTPMTIAQFLRSERARKRYWAGSHLGWQRFNSARPNSGHRALVELERAGILRGVITQNVDGLHTAAGSRRVVPLHGTMDRVLCLDCGQVFAREDIAARIDAANPWLARSDSAQDVKIAPDGDADVSDFDDVVLPVCTVCGGTLKPDVVFFGEFIPTERFAEASSLLDASGALLVAGSSLAVNSGIRLIEQARRKRMPIIVINRGATKGDSRATVKLDSGTSQTLSALAARLSA
ncbi:Sir2 family NAD-dependent protein deacetylase [Rathayibacter soli]|uniref:Sir2 family NAD-dependent protein deacetylase n=1 Tax=Rathayibacter soli TaxID=3144168 RepID=UPI0027E4ABF7|nr:Sir2 family NAD-dependent protein deacetylase [Glaciibacter superstes]